MAYSGTPSQMNTATAQSMGRRISRSPCRTGRSMRKPSPRRIPSTMSRPSACILRKCSRRFHFRKSLSQDIGERFRPFGNNTCLLPMAHLSQGYLSRVEREKPDRHLYHAPRHLSEFQRRKRGDGVMLRGIPRAVILSEAEGSL